MATTGLLTGRLAVVTGGGSGIGRAVCQVFAREGAKVAVVDLNEAGANETTDLIGPDSAKVFKGDISSSSSVNDLLSSIASTFSDVPTVLVNSAGITRDCFLLEMKEENFDKVMDVNLKGTYLMTQALSQMITTKGRKNGSIVNISSIVGKAGNAGQTNYAASKAGVIGFTKSAAIELGRSGIRVNAVLPGFIETPMIAPVPEKIVNNLIRRIALGRVGQPEEVAEACLFLASEKSSYMTGGCLEVAGGLAM